MISLQGHFQRQADGVDLRLSADEAALLSDALARAAARLDTYVRSYPQGKRAGCYQKQANRMRELRARLPSNKRGASS
jgi:hypothetical protein